ncbi:metallophosphoesterase [Klenkia sp. PcliD-1-E]|uniref:metallophosphoesterase n=1 Tax=Klenkia sp. PcliD-1-E TaxID=2954492 RepID=UPI002097D54F|nr:metallophosphoesterase [Klenkia sp. PcliD-1-E]MCO7222509.1 metallophosphoesterase [Klenkia sp. PcliD-1-E]
MIAFGAVVSLAMVLLHGYLWSRLVRSTTRPGVARRWLTVAVVVLAVLVVAAVVGRRSLPFSVQTPLDWVGYTWLGLAFYLFLALLVLEPVRWLLRARQRRAPAPEPEPVAVAEPEPEPADVSRRLFLARSLAVTAGVAAAGTAGYGLWAANSAPLVRRVPIRLAGLAPELAGYRIVTFSDGHLSATYGGRRFERLVETVNAQQPDVVAVVGDLVDGSLAQLREDVAPLGDLVSRQGAFFVTGNHEYFVPDTDEWLRHLPTLGVDVLRNERVELGRGEAVFDLAGIDDRTAASSGLPGHGADLDAALDGRDDTRPVVLLAHQPVQVEQARAAGVDLQLSGHTHGGQLWPFDYAVLLDQPAVEGLSRQGDTQLYVTAGAGYWGPPMRVGARPEVTVIELQPE